MLRFRHRIQVACERLEAAFSLILKSWEQRSLKSVEVSWSSCHWACYTGVGHCPKHRVVLHQPLMAQIRLLNQAPMLGAETLIGSHPCSSNPFSSQCTEVSSVSSFCWSLYIPKMLLQAVRDPFERNSFKQLPLQPLLWCRDHAKEYHGRSEKSSNRLTRAAWCCWLPVLPAPVA